MILSVFLLASSTGCSALLNGQAEEKETVDPKQSASNKPTEANATEKKESQLKRELTEEEKIMMKPPGKYGGDRYDEAKVKAELDKLPDDLTTEQYFEEFLKLMAEDYRSSVTTFVNFDPSVEVDHAKPNENIMLPASKKLHFSILLDASGSMNGKVGNRTKMDAAKEAIQQFVSKLPQNASISLRVYGHKGSNSSKDKALSCSSTEEVYQGVGYQSGKFQTALDQVKPAGWTPIAKALESVKKDVDPDTTETMVYVVSDGIETCGGDPVKAAQELNGSNIKTVVNIIGFDVDNNGQKMLKQVADAGEGEYTSVDDEQALKEHLKSEYEQLKKDWLEWKEKGKAEAMKKKEKKKKIAMSTKEEMKKLTAREKEHLKMAYGYLKDKFGNNHPVNGTFNLILDRNSMIFSYAVNTGSGLWSEVVENGSEKWSEIVEEGNKGIDDAIEKKNSQ